MIKQLYYLFSFLAVGIITTMATSCKEESNTLDNTFTDPRDGNVYHTVTIGTKVWMAENLRYLPSVVEPSTGSENETYHYVYGYYGTSIKQAKDNPNYKTYGVLYNWAAAKAACPEGWHLPTDAEWLLLAAQIGGEAMAGGKLKECGTNFWNSPNQGATNETGFCALPGGYRHYNSSFEEQGNYGIWWTATENNYNEVIARYLTHEFSTLNSSKNSKMQGFSVRCVKD